MADQEDVEGGNYPTKHESFCFRGASEEGRHQLEAMYQLSESQPKYDQEQIPNSLDR